jgi:hypothetical protein
MSGLPLPPGSGAPGATNSTDKVTGSDEYGFSFVRRFSLCPHSRSKQPIAAFGSSPRLTFPTCPLCFPTASPNRKARRYLAALRRGGA